jgi:putative transposase
MARLSRLCLPGLPHHLTLRGNNGQSVFVDDQDRQAWLDAMSMYSTEMAMDVHAWVLTVTGAQLLLTPSRPEVLSAFMQALGRKYTRAFNLRHFRSGTLWEGRYRSAVLQPERYLIACMVYMDTIPVREGLAGEPADYRWSSHTHYIGQNQDRRLTPHAEYWRLGNTPFAREAAYRQRVFEGLSNEEIRALSQATQHGWVVGDLTYVRSLEGQFERRLTRTLAGRPPRQKLSVPN